MATLLDFIVALLTSIGDLVVIFLRDVALRGDPLALLVFLVGAGLTTAAVAGFGAALHALAQELLRRRDPMKWNGGAMSYNEMKDVIERAGSVVPELKQSKPAQADPDAPDTAPA